MNITVRYELRFKTTGAAWRVFNSYKKIDDLELIKYHKAYTRSPIIEAVEVVEITTTKKIVSVNY